MKKTKRTALQSLRLALADADKTLKDAKATLADFAQAHPKASAGTPQRLDALPPTPEVQRVNNSPYRKEARQ